MTVSDKFKANSDENRTMEPVSNILEDNISFLIEENVAICIIVSSFPAMKNYDLIDYCKSKLILEKKCLFFVKRTNNEHYLFQFFLQSLISMSVKTLDFIELFQA